MTALPAETVIIGGGFAGSVLALKLAAAGRPAVLIDPASRPGPGLAYGAAAAHHLLNVPAARMEIGLRPGFLDHVRQGLDRPDVTEALAEAGGRLEAAFLPRRLFGAYLSARMREALTEGRITHIRALAADIEKASGHLIVHLEDGRRVEASRVILASGNLPPGAPHVADASGRLLQDAAPFVPDPWQAGALAQVAADEDVVLIGTGLTAVDIWLSLRAQGHKGRISAVSRHGLLPLGHEAGGDWPPFLLSQAGKSPRHILQSLREEARKAEAAGVPWQRVMDAARPAVAQAWRGWNRRQRAQFLRHGRAWWDVHRHRLAPRLAERLRVAVESGDLKVLAGRLKGFEALAGRVRLHIRPRHESGLIPLEAGWVINCTGPRSDLGRLNLSLFSRLRERGLMRADSLSLGMETRDAQVLDAEGHPVAGLYAVSALTRPAWWEITAVPEINAQLSLLAAGLIDQNVEKDEALAREFVDLGAGI